MQRSKEDIVDYFREVISGFIYHDIERCIEARANYIVALALLSYTEYIGGLISGNLGLNGKRRDNFNEALEYFPEKEKYQEIDSKLKIEYIDEKGQTKSDTGIYSLFRCGMIHEYFIKAFSATKVNNNPDGYCRDDRIGIQIETAANDSDKRLVFYTNEYFRDFRLAVDKLYKLLVLDSNPELMKGFNESLDRISARRIT